MRNLEQIQALVAQVRRLQADLTAILGDASPAPDPEPVALKAEDVAKMLSCSKTHVYELVRTGQIRSIRLGKSVRIPADEVPKLLKRATRG